MRKFNSCVAGICTVLIIMFSAYDYLVPNTVPSTVTIYPESEKNERSNASEIWLTDILLNGKEQDLSQYLTNENWSYHEENNDLFSGSAAESPDGILTLKFPPAKSITLVFSMHAWCGKIQLKEAEQIIEKDLYSKDSDIFEYQLQTNMTGRMQPGSILRSIAVFLTLSILSTFCISRYKKALNKTRPYIGAFLHFCISIRTDDLAAFEIRDYTVEYLILKIIFGICLLCLWRFLFYLAEQLREGNSLIRDGIKYFIIYWIFLSIVMLCIWPGNWIWDDIFIYEDAVCLRFTPWQHILTSVFYILSLMFIPAAAGIVICQYTIIAGITAAVLTICNSMFHSKKLICFMCIPFLLPPILAHDFYPLRLSLYAFLELLFLFLFYVRQRVNKKSTWCFWTGMVIINILLSTWRSEGIFFLFMGPVLVFFHMEKRFRKKMTIVYSLILFTGFTVINSVQNFYIAEKKDYYGVTAYMEALDDLVKYEYRKNADSKLLEPMSQKVDLELILDSQSGEDAFWGGAYADISTSEDYKMVRDTYVSLLKAYPLPWLEERMLTFLTTSACTSNSHAFTGNDCEIAVPEFLENYKLTKPINSRLRCQVLNLLTGRKSSLDGINIFYRIFYNIIPSVLICFAGLFVCLRIKNKKGLCYFTLVLHFSLVFAAAPGVYFMYYLPVYLCGYTFFTYECISRIKKKQTENYGIQNQGGSHG